MDRKPGYWSLVLADMPAPDYADMSIGVLPAGSSTDAAVWARSIFSIRTMPGWIRAALVVRQVFAPVIGVPRAKRDVFAVRSVVDNEALLSVDDRHLDFRVGVGVDEVSRLVRVTTAVTLNGWRGRLYFAPVRLAHPIVVHAMLRRAQRVLSP